MSIVLHSEDILERIFAYLVNIRDLQRASAVCKTWQCIAKKEISRRKGLQAIKLPTFCQEHYYDLFSSYIEPQHNPTNDDFLNALHFVPTKTCFIFCEVLNGEYEDEYDLDDFYHGCTECFPYKSLISEDIFTVLIYAHGTEEMGSCNMRQISALFLPLEFETFIITQNYAKTVCCIDCQWGGGPTCWNHVNPCEPLGSVLNECFNQNENHTLILFENVTRSDMQTGYAFDESYELFRNIFFEALKRGYKKGNTLWGGTVHSYSPKYHKKDPFYIILKLSGQAVQSWSIVFNSNVSEIDVKDQLTNLRDRLTLKSKSIAFCIENCPFGLTSGYSDWFKTIFPTIRLINFHLYNVHDEYPYADVEIFSLNSISDEDRPKLRHDYYATAFLILTYDETKEKNDSDTKEETPL